MPLQGHPHKSKPQGGIPNTHHDPPSPSPIPRTYTSVNERAKCFFDFQSTHRSILLDMLKPPTSEHAMFCAETYWKKKVEQAYRDWISLLVCPVCRWRFEDIYTGDRGVWDTSGKGQDRSESEEEELESGAELEGKTEKINDERRESENTKEKKYKKRQFGEDPWDLIVGTKETMLNTKPWNLSAGLVKEWKERWNRGSEIWVFEEGLHLTEGELDVCCGFEGMSWDRL